MKNEKVFLISRQYTPLLFRDVFSWLRQERYGRIVQTTLEQDDQERNDKNGATFIVPFLRMTFSSLHSCFRCNTQISKIANFKRNFLNNYNDSKQAVKTKNVPFFMNFSNITFS